VRTNAGSHFYPTPVAQISQYSRILGKHDRSRHRRGAQVRAFHRTTGRPFHENTTCVPNYPEETIVTEQMTIATIDTTAFRTAFLRILWELFEPFEGRHDVLDEGTSLFETLRDITPDEANISVSGQSASLAAQVQHTTFYIDAIREGLATNWTNSADWDASWQIEPVEAVTWQTLIDRLRAAYAWSTEFAEDTSDWNAVTIGVAFALVAHAAYHLGEIRQGIGVVRSA